MNIEHPVAYQAEPAPVATPEAVATPAPENYEALLQRARACGRVERQRNRRRRPGSGTLWQAPITAPITPTGGIALTRWKIPVRFQLAPALSFQEYYFLALIPKCPERSSPRWLRTCYDNATGSDLLIRKAHA